jgi:hypothetical protein
VRITTPKEIESVLRLEGPQRFAHFVKRMADEQRVWGLWDDGWASMEDDDGVMVLPVWPAREYAELFVNGDWSSYVPTEMPLDEFLDEMIPEVAEQSALVGVFPTPTGKSVTPPLPELEEALREELTNYS